METGFFEFGQLIKKFFHKTFNGDSDEGAAVSLHSAKESVEKSFFFFWSDWRLFHPSLNGLYSLDLYFRMSRSELVLDKIQISRRFAEGNIKV